MILQYFKNKENKEQIIAIEQYKKILIESKQFLNSNNFFKIKDYKTSFEIVSIFLIMFIRRNLLEHNKKKYLKVNEKLISLFKNFEFSNLGIIFFSFFSLKSTTEFIDPVKI